MNKPKDSTGCCCPPPPCSADPFPKWKWMMDYCKDRRRHPSDFWDLAEKAWREVALVLEDCDGMTATIDRWGKVTCTDKPNATAQGRAVASNVQQIVGGSDTEERK